MQCEVQYSGGAVYTLECAVECEVKCAVLFVAHNIKSCVFSDNVHIGLNLVQCVVFSVQFVVCSLQCSVCSVPCAVKN